jgi:hypothetical protein
LSIAYLYRRDDRNAGDTFCAPHLYFDLPPGAVMDIFETPDEIDDSRVLIVGGGGLGRKFFAKRLKQLARENRPYRLIAWGVGSDTVIRKDGTALPRQDSYDLFSRYFDDFDEIGIRSWSEDAQKYPWVPCVSAMHAAFDKYRDVKPTRLVGHYQHKNFPFARTEEITGLGSNNGNDLDAKLSFLADHEFIVANTYHGVYWATLLGRRVLCLPFKSGLLSFRHKPVYIDGQIPTDDDLHQARAYPDSLEMCRNANIAFRERLGATYGL